MRLALTLVLLALPALSATVRGPADVATLTAGADAVVHGRVARRSSDWAGGSSKSGLIQTQVVLEPLEVWKGAALSGPITVRVPGGAAGDYDQLVLGAAQFTQGEEVVVYLRKLAPGLFEVSRWALGKFTVSAARSGPRAQRDRTGLTCVGCGADEADELSLEELRGRTLRAAGGKK